VGFYKLPVKLLVQAKESCLRLCIEQSDNFDELVEAVWTRKEDEGFLVVLVLPYHINIAGVLVEGPHLPLELVLLVGYL